MTRNSKPQDVPFHRRAMWTVSVCPGSPHGIYLKWCCFIWSDMVMRMTVHRHLPARRKLYKYYSTGFISMSFSVSAVLGFAAVRPMPKSEVTVKGPLSEQRSRSPRLSDLGTIVVFSEVCHMLKGHVRRLRTFKTEITCCNISYKYFPFFSSYSFKMQKILVIIVYIWNRGNYASWKDCCTTSFCFILLCAI